MWGNPFLAAVQPLQEHGLLFAEVAAGAGFVILSLRYMGAGPRLSPPIRPIAASTPGWRLAGYVASVAVPLALMSGLIHAPIDLAVLLIGLVAARPLGAAIAAATGLTKLLAGIPLPLRLVLGIVAAGLINKAYFSVFFDIDTSRFFHANVAIILDLLVISIVAAPGVAAARQLRTRSASPVGLVVAATAAALAWPTPVFADNCGDWIDCVGDNTRAAVAAAAAAAIFAAKFLWDWARDVFGAPQPIGTLDKLASEEGAAAQDGAMSALRGQAANRALESGDTDRFSQIRNMSNGEFYQAAQRGDFSDLGIGPF
jgi:hypothetical protein